MKIFQPFIYLGVLLLLTSCGDTEHVLRFHTDGSVKMDITGKPNNDVSRANALSFLKTTIEFEGESLDTSFYLTDLPGAAEDNSPESMKMKEIFKDFQFMAKISPDVSDTDMISLNTTFNSEQERDYASATIKTMMEADQSGQDGLGDLINLFFDYTYDAQLGKISFIPSKVPDAIFGGVPLEMMMSMMTEEDKLNLRKEIPGAYIKRIVVPGKITSVSGGDFKQENDSTLIYKQDFFDFVYNSGIPETTILFESRNKITDPTLTEVWDPEPTVVTPGNTNREAPSDAIVLFDGKNFDEWCHYDSTTVQWKKKKDYMIIEPGTGAIKTKRIFGDCQLHIEWSSPDEPKREGQDKGNSGIFFQNKYEIQVLNSYNNRTYANGQAGAIYKQAAPLVNAMRAPEKWNTYDIIFHEPKFDIDGNKIKDATITAIHNGVVVQDHFSIQGTTEYIGLPLNIAHGDGPIVLQDHSNKVRYRNIWVREL